QKLPQNSRPACLMQGPLLAHLYPELFSSLGNIWLAGRPAANKPLAQWIESHPHHRVLLPPFDRRLDGIQSSFIWVPASREKPAMFTDPSALELAAVARDQAIQAANQLA